MLDVTKSCSGDRGTSTENGKIRKWEQNLICPLVLSVTSLSILCFVPIFYFPVPRARSTHPVPRFNNNLLVPHNYIDMLNCILFIWLYFVRLPIYAVSRSTSPPPPPGEALPYKRLMRMCRWMGSHFHDQIDYSGVPFSIVIRMGLIIFWFWG